MHTLARGIVTRPFRSARLTTRLGASIALLCVVAATGCTHDISDKDIKEIGLTEVRALTAGKDAAKTMLVDPRAEGDYNAGHIPGAHNLGVNSERAAMGEGLNPVFKGYKHIIVYGNDPSSGPAVAMTKRLMMKKADGVRLFRGGLTEWRRAGLPVDKVEGASAPKAGAAADPSNPGT